MVEKEVFLTKEGLLKLEEELEELKTIKRKEIADKIKVARGFGDLSENAEPHLPVRALHAHDDRIPIHDAHHRSGEDVPRLPLPVFKPQPPGQKG